MGEGFGDDGGGFAEVAVFEGGAAFAGVVGDDEGEAGVLGAGPEGGFAEAGVADDSGVLGIDEGEGFEGVEHAGEAPGPGADAGPVGGVDAGGESAADAVFPAVGVVGFEIAAVGGGEGVAAVNEEFEGEAGAFGAA